MKLSKETLSILKNFSTINGNLLITPGNTLKTLSGAKSVFASATVKEEFDTEFGIYDLNEFLGALSLYDDPEITFSNKYVKIEQGGSFKFWSADPSVLTYPQKDIKQPESYIEFDITENDLALIQKTVGIIGASDIKFEGRDGKLSFVVEDKKNSSSNNFSKEIGETDKVFSAYLKQDNMKFIVDDYTVSISDKKIAQFEGNKVNYFVSLEADSTFE